MRCFELVVTYRVDCDDEAGEGLDLELVADALVYEEFDRARSEFVYEDTDSDEEEPPCTTWTVDRWGGYDVREVPT
jgi:hypothetical protein